MSTIHSLLSSPARANDLKPTPLAKQQKDSAPQLNQLQTKILQTLAQQIPGMTLDGLKKLDANQFTPEKVADRISGFVAQGLEMARARGASDERIQELYNSAMKGVEKGFKEAKDILDGLGVLNGKIAEDVAKTEALTFEKLRNLSPDQRMASDLVAMSVVQRFERADRFELNITTKEGDQVNIRFDRSDSFQAGLSMAKDGKGNSAMVFDMSRTQSSGFSFSIEGNLNLEEIDAIQSLIRDVSQLADEFFNGDVQRAFEKAGDLSLNTAQLSGFELSLSRTEVRSMAGQYQQTQRLADPVEEQRPGRRLGQLVQEMRDEFNNRMLEFVQDQMGFGKSLMQSLVEQDSRFKLANAEQQSRYQDNLGKLLNAIDSSKAAE